MYINDINKYPGNTQDPQTEQNLHAQGFYNKTETLKLSTKGSIKVENCKISKELADAIISAILENGGELVLKGVTLKEDAPKVTYTEYNSEKPNIQYYNTTGYDKTPSVNSQDDDLKSAGPSPNEFEQFLNEFRERKTKAETIDDDPLDDIIAQGISGDIDYNTETIVNGLSDAVLDEIAFKTYAHEAGDVVAEIEEKEFKKRNKQTK